ncbi:cell division protein FtsL [Halalkalibacter oceani]|uniref:Cell division protein FtsL n=1 Tax=Halalkalibacter oceani TaxID=1653776 RepID=A0A9X2DLS0_9BACI|nr:cell division protein FtsL [Halalkalibacter oceani]MCM3713096.1 cell division protein FtsL [Halalkalibacter oceani]
MNMVARKYQEQQQQQVQTKTRVRRVRMNVTFGEKLIIGFIVACTFLMVSMIVHNYATIYGTNQEVYELEALIAEQVQLNEGLSLQVVELSAPDRILYLASEELGMTLDDNKVKVVNN